MVTTLTQHVKGKTKFSFYRAGNLYYVNDLGLEYPIPTSDVEGATLLNEDKALYHMRWIRKHLKTLEQA